MEKHHTLITDHKEKAEVLNNQFKQVFTDEDLSCISDKGKSSVPDIPPVSFSFAGITKLQLSLNEKKAIKVMKMAAKEIAPVLQILFYQSMVTGSLPPDWLLANITPIFKKEKRSDPSNFRPISLTSMTCKLMERVICSEIMNHLETTNYLVNFQHGFRRNHSFESQLIITINDLAKTLDDSGQTDLIILDFSKAFDHDSASHQRLLHKLDHCGVRGDTINWICSLLTQRVVVNGKESEVVKVKSGVPQGTVLGPLMFLIYINDIGAEIKSSIKVFADDCLLYKRIKSPNDANAHQQDLNNFLLWADKWQLKFNTSKSYDLQVTKKKTLTLQL